MPLALELGYDVIRNYKRLSYKPWYAIAELVDNSTQSYFNNKSALDSQFVTDNQKPDKQKLEIRIVYDKANGLLRVSDTAMGMSYDELRDALKVGKRPQVTSGRSQFGMGLKTSACWFGNIWKVITKKLGETTEYEVTVDVDKVADGQTSLEERVTPGKRSELHYTIVEIMKHNVRLQGKTIKKIKTFLRSIYRVDLRDGRLRLFWEDEELKWNDEFNFMKAKDGSHYKKDFEFLL